MKRIFKFAGLFLGLLIMAVFLYGAKGYLDALSDAPRLRLRANDLISQGRGAASLGAKHLAMLLKVEDPNFAQHMGVDFSTPGAGATTITQSASKRLAFKKFHPGIGKIRQTGYAIGLETRLSKEQILALWFDTLEMGEGPRGWMTGFDKASSAIYNRSPDELSDREFIRLVAVLIAPGSYKLGENDPALNERVSRIERLIAGICVPEGHGDVWLEGCRKASPNGTDEK
ncbi:MULTISPECIES: transglycosylase domain-containing protein [unclassified Ochrobactrum]|uniref:transglycosylase domain-containing protein n=1 Tax=unclassified Ochrobactrum TaxID=239106 RepID=UPI002570EAC7|nr:MULTISPECIES: transglycosylase domain-containing protein [unclassified Ochrobactrum]